MAEKFEWIEENSKRKRERTSRRNNEAPTCEVSVRNSKTDGGNHDSTGESRQSSNRGSRKSKKSSVSSRRRLRVDGDDVEVVDLDEHDVKNLLELLQYFDTYHQ